MDVFRRFLGSLAPQPSEPDNVFLQGDGLYACPTVGESNYQDALEAICGGRTEDAASHDCIAHLILEDSNPYDNQAVRVDIEGRTIGYLSREMARRFRISLRPTGKLRAVLTCNARIGGGWDRERRGKHSRGHFGVQLDLRVEDD